MHTVLNHSKLSKASLMF